MLLVVFLVLLLVLVLTAATAAAAAAAASTAPPAPASAAAVFIVLWQLLRLIPPPWPLLPVFPLLLLHGMLLLLLWRSIHMPIKQHASVPLLLLLLPWWPLEVDVASPCRRPPLLLLPAATALVCVCLCSHTRVAPRLAVPLELFPDVRHRLTEVDLDATVVDEHVVHFEVGGLAGLVVVVPDKRVAQRVACLVVADDVARRYVAKPGVV